MKSVKTTMVGVLLALPLVFVSLPAQADTNAAGAFKVSNYNQSTTKFKATKHQDPNYYKQRANSSKLNGNYMRKMSKKANEVKASDKALAPKGGKYIH